MVARIKKRCLQLKNTPAINKQMYKISTIIIIEE